MWVFFFSGMYLNIETREEFLRGESPCHGDGLWTCICSDENRTLYCAPFYNLISESGKQKQW